MGLKNIKSTTKLFLAIIFFSIVSVVTIATNAIRTSRNGLNELGKVAITKTHQTTVESVRMYDKNTRWKFEGDLSFFKREIETKRWC